MIELSSLPPIEFASKDVHQIEADTIITYEAISGRKLAPGDPVRLFLQAIAQIIAHQRSLIDYSAKMNLLAFSEGAYLDHIGALVETARLPAQAAETTVRFTLSAPQPQDVIIPAGIRVTPDGQLFFATTDPTTVPTGATSADVLVQCLVDGLIGNQWEPGQINKLVDPLPWIRSVANLTTGSGGAEIEGDERYRLRIQQAPVKFSVAGPEGAYRYWAQTAHQSIADVSVLSPAPGEVEIRPLLEGGQIPGAEILQAVEEICNSRSIRPLTDMVSVLAPDVVTYNIELTYWIGAVSASMAAIIQDAVETAVDEYQAWQRSRLGRDLNPSELIARVMRAGAKRVDVAFPAYAHVGPAQVALAENITVVYGGLEDD